MDGAVCARFLAIEVACHLYVVEKRREGTAVVPIAPLEEGMPAYKEGKRSAGNNGNGTPFDEV